VRRAEEGLRAIEAGGIPPAARERLTALAASGSGFFTSDLSVSEFLLVKEAGFRPLTQVMGSCFYNVGWQYMPGMSYGYGGWGASGTVELDVQSEAWNEARRLALDRLAQEAKLAGADAVLGVEITRSAYDWAQGLIEFAAIGTAVVSDRYDFGDDDVFLSSLSGQEFASLVRNGYMPVGICAGSTVAYVVGGGQTMQALSGYGARWQNQELTELTRGLYAARQLAMRRVERQAHEVGAGGLVGVQIEQSQHPREFEQQGYKRLDLIVTMHVIGTAVVPIDDPAEPPPTYIALSLTEERR
jgi:uncharacterized protein YbjQ (UPF0145 family)